jgi:hypothetical protein
VGCRAVVTVGCELGCFQPSLDSSTPLIVWYGRFTHTLFTTMSVVTLRRLVMPALTEHLGFAPSHPQNVPVANASYDDIKDLLGGALFLPLYKWMEDSGPVYLLPTGPTTNFLVISDPQCAKHVLRDYTLYNKGLVSEVRRRHRCRRPLASTNSSVPPWRQSA